LNADCIYPNAKYQLENVAGRQLFKINSCGLAHFQL